MNTNSNDEIDLIDLLKKLYNSRKLIIRIYMFGFGRKELKEYNYSAEEMAKFNFAKLTTDNGFIWLKLFNEENYNHIICSFKLS